MKVLPDAEAAARPMAAAETPPDKQSVAVILPCYNEEVAIGDVVRRFRTALPDARIYVYDNASSDATASRAREAGAIVRAEPMRGKGNVVRRMFADVEADIYVMADGDGTYDATLAPALVERLRADNLDMVVGTRLGSHGQGLFRGGHRLGNRALSWLAGHLFHHRLADVLSGYRVFSRRFVKSFPALSSGFEIETELTLHALELRLPIAEVETAYAPRPEGSVSKLNTVRDGIRILWRLTVLMKELKPLVFFGAIATVLASVSVILAGPIFATFMDTGLVPRIPTAGLATGIMLLAFLGLTSGLILDSLSRARLEAKRTAYLRFPGPLTGADES